LSKNPIHNVVKVHELEVMAVVPRLLFEPAGHYRLDMRIGMSVTNENSNPLVHETAKLK
jgi:hypothetical protein